MTWLGIEPTFWPDSTTRHKKNKKKNRRVSYRLRKHAFESISISLRSLSFIKTLKFHYYYWNCATSTLKSRRKLWNRAANIEMSQKILKSRSKYWNHAKNIEILQKILKSRQKYWNVAENTEITQQKTEITIALLGHRIIPP